MHKLKEFDRPLSSMPVEIERVKIGRSSGNRGTLTKVSNKLMHKLKEFDRPLFQMAMEIEMVKIGRSSENHGSVTKPGSALSSGNFIEGSKEEVEILAEA
jgi:CO dehydrogenase/acetyl-CoA synthase delta subunit